jgi:D-alanyl-D-alanine-carboxypeptidase/D-alanyl-D-alanine-endopeptidase
LGLFLLLSFRIDISFLDNKEVTLVQGDTAYFEEYKETIQNYLDKNKIPGLIVGVVNGEEKALFTYGYDQLDKSGEITAETMFEIGSITKVFTAIMLADSMTSENISLEDTVDMYIDSSKIGTDNVFDSVTLKELTTHTSGLSRLPSSFNFAFSTYIAGLTGTNPYKNLSKEEMYQFMEDTRKLSGDQGSWEYSNYGVGILGMCLTESRQTSYEAMLKEIITEPLGMTNTSTLYDAYEDDLYADGFRGYAALGPLKLGIKSSPWIMKEGIVAAGGIRSTGNDMLLFLDALVDRTVPSIEMTTQPLLQVDETFWMGMNFIIDRKEDSDEALIWHNGETGGFNSYIGFYEDIDSCVFLVTNSLVNIEDLAHELFLLSQE